MQGTVVENAEGLEDSLHVQSALPSQVPHPTLEPPHYHLFTQPLCTQVSLQNSRQHRPNHRGLCHISEKLESPMLTMVTKGNLSCLTQRKERDHRASQSPRWAQDVASASVFVFRRGEETEWLSACLPDSLPVSLCKGNQPPAFCSLSAAIISIACTVY